MKNFVRILPALFGIAFVGFGSVQGFGQDWSAEQKEVWNLEKASYELLKAGDLKGYLGLWHQDAADWSFRGQAPITKEFFESVFTTDKFPTVAYEKAMLSSGALAPSGEATAGLSTEPPINTAVYETAMLSSGALAPSGEATAGLSEAGVIDDKFKIDACQPKYPRVNIFGNVAIVYFRATTEEFSGYPSLHTRAIKIWMKQDGKWQRIGGMTAKE